LQLDLPKFEAANAQVLGISVDFNGANQAWAEKLGLKYPLLSDTRRDMSRAYSVLRDDPAAAKDPKRIAGYLRAIPTIMVVDKQGTIRYVRDNSSERNTIPMDEVLAAVEKAK
jgi:glutaredoxin-dependent peroxiredoxin